MKTIAYFLFALFPCIISAQIMEPFLLSDYNKDLHLCCQCGLDEAVRQMALAETSETYFFYKGKVYAYSEVLRLLDEE